VVDADLEVVRRLEICLTLAGYEVDTAADGPEALSRARKVRPDAVLLDLTLPSMDGLTVLHDLRATGIEAPVLFVTARDALQDKVVGLAAGADDYITKPFNVDEVVTRLWVVLRRTSPGGDDGDTRQRHRLGFADLVIDEDSHEVWRGDELISLSPNEFGLLRYFVINAGTVLSKRSILAHVWPERPTANGNVVQSCVSHLRRKVDDREPRVLHTVRGLGYVLREDRNKRHP
jgi:two-component system OmpR family response regulator